MQKSTVYYSPLPKDISFFGLKSTFPRQKFTFFSKKKFFCLETEIRELHEISWSLSLLTNNHLVGKGWPDFMLPYAYPISKFKLI